MTALKRLIILIYLCVSYFTANAQLTENFSDGELGQNPTWSGDTDEFLVDASFLLQSNGDTISSPNREIYISTPSVALVNAQWEFFVNPKVGTSSNNRMDVFLSSNSDVLTGNNQGYFVRIGGTPDEVALFRKDGAGIENYVINGVTGAINSSSTNPTKIKVTRDNTGLWSLFADYEGSGLLYNLVGSATDLTYTSSTHFGLVVRYSNSYRQKYYMDNIAIGDIVVDTVPPNVLQLNVIGPQELEVVFSEVVDQTSVENEGNYSVDGGLGQPLSAVRNNLLFQRVTLQFATPFAQGQTYILSLSNVSDLGGNTLAGVNFNFVYYRAKPYDVVINEIMADPTPVVLQPDAEWIELHNRTAYPLNLKDWFIQVNSTIRQITNTAVILPDSFLVLSNLSGFEALFTSAAVTEVTSFPSLTNTGASIRLLDPDSVLISAVAYSDQWYNNSIKYEGGWSLEQISVLKPCEGAINWTASNHPSGATPGRTNSVNASIADESLPEIERVVLLASDTLRVFFNETVTEASSTETFSYTIDNGVNNPISVETYPPDFKSVKLTLAAPILEGVIYSLTVAAPVSDCSGNVVNVEISRQFAIPEAIIQGDIVINEILSDPKEGGTDYIELFNRSAKVLDLGELYLSNQDTISNELEGLSPIAPDRYLLFPGSYILLSEDAEAVKNGYFSTNYEVFLEMDDFPSYNNESGIVVLSKFNDSQFIDRVIYDADMHFELLNSTDGVSLERINFDRPSTDRSNWNSAASDRGFGTPGYQNSQFTPLLTQQEGALEITPEVFSPDNDGFDDVITAYYTFEAPGFTGSVSIFDQKGRLVKTLIKSALFGSQGTISWDGITDNQTKASVGMYIIYLEAFNTNGATVKLKKPLVVASKL